MADDKNIETTWEYIIPSLRYGFDDSYDPPVFEDEEEEQMGMNNQKVLQKWVEGESADSHTGALRTDGTKLFSYNLQIGYRSKSGVTVLGDFTSPGGAFRSMTTSCHVGKARAVADHIMHPTVFKNSEFK